MAPPGPVGGNNSYLVCEGRGERAQHLSVQFPFCLILHVGHLDFDRHWTLQIRSGHYTGKSGSTRNLRSLVLGPRDNVTCPSGLLDSGLIHY